MDSIEEYVTLRDQKLSEGDLDWLIEQGGCPPDLVECILLKCLHEAICVSRALRVRRGEWLRKSGFEGFSGPLCPEEVLLR